jgi:transposase
MLKDHAAAATPTPAPSDLRLRRPDRGQVVWAASALDALLPQGHQARVIWAVVRTLDLSAFHAPIKARSGVCGRNATDPALLISLWLYAATDGVGSAQELARLCEQSDPYKWLCGGVSLNHHTLSDFRVGHRAALDGLFTQVLASLVDQDIVPFDCAQGVVERISNDGTRVRACAGAASFRGAERLATLLAEAKAHVAELAALLDDPERSAELTARERAAQRRAARERVERVQAAIDRLPEIRAAAEAAAVAEAAAEAAAALAAATTPADAPSTPDAPAAPGTPAAPEPAPVSAKGKRKANAKGKTKRKPKGKPRVSTTDPDVRVMKMGDGGFRPAMNIQFGVDTACRAIVGVSVSTVGSDMGLAPPMRDQVEARTGCKVREHLVDGGYLILDEIDAAAAAGVDMYVHPKTPSDPTKLDQRYVPKPDDTPAVAAWRQRMGTEPAQAVYRERASTVETANADLKTHRAMARFLVRGTDKVLSCALWSAVAYNLLHFGAQMIA